MALCLLVNGVMMKDKNGKHLDYSPDSDPKLLFRSRAAGAHWERFVMKKEINLHSLPLNICCSKLCCSKQSRNFIKVNFHNVSTVYLKKTNLWKPLQIRNVGHTFQSAIASVRLNF